MTSPDAHDKTVGILPVKEEELQAAPGGPDEYRTRHVDVRVEASVALGAVALGVALFVVSADIRIGTIPDPITSRGFPYAVSAALIVGGIFALVRAYLRWRRAGSWLVPSDGATDTEGHPASFWRPAAAFAATVVWLVALPYLGFVIVTPLLIAALLEVMAVRGHLKIVLISLISTVVAFAVFFLLLRVYFPLGPLDEPFRALDLVP